MDDSIFTFVDSVLVNKKKVSDLNESETQFSLYMMDRWISMYSPEMANYINETTNKYGKILETKQDQYNYIFNIIPKCKKKRLEYIKKNKDKNIPSDDTAFRMKAKYMECSVRELKYMEEQLGALKNG